MACASKKSVAKAMVEKYKLKGHAKALYKEVGQNICLIGKCGDCGSPLMYYVKSNPENIFNYYCINSENPEEACAEDFRRDVREPKDKDWFINNENPLQIIADIQKEFNHFEITDELIKKGEKK